MAIPLHVLIVEDQPADAELIVLRLVKEGFQLDWQRVQTEADYLSALANHPDLILSDWSLPQFSGLRALELARELGLETPFIIVSGSIGEEAAVSALRMGAFDYVLKDRPDRIGQAVQNALEQKRLRAERSQAQKMLIYQSDLLANVNDAIIASDPQQHLTFWNRAAEILYGWNAEEVIGRTVQEVLRSELFGTTSEEVSRLLRENGSVVVEYTQYRKDGQAIHVEAKTVELRDETWRLTGYTSVNRDITARKRAEENLARQTHELQKQTIEIGRLYRTAATLIFGAALDLESLGQTIVKTIIHEYQKSNCSLHLVSQDSNELRCLARAGEFSDSYPLTRLTLDGPGLIPLAIRTDQLINCPDVRLDPNYLPAWQDAVSELVIPLKVSERVIGGLNLESANPASFSADDERLLLVFASQAAIVIENANLIAETQRQVDRLKALRSVDETITASLDLKVTSAILLEQLTGQLKVDAADLLLFDAHTKNLTFANGQGFKTDPSQRGSQQMGQGLARKVVNERQTVHISDLAAFMAANPKADPGSLSRVDENIQQDASRVNPAEYAYIQAEQFTEYFGVPLIAKGTVKGVLEIFNRSPLPADSRWLDFLSNLTGQAAIAIDNIELFQNLQRSNDELALAYDATIEGWSRTLELRELGTKGHNQRVAETTLRLAQASGIQDEELVHIRRGALLHDIGKMGISDSILLKTGPFSEEEEAILHQHPLYALELLSPIKFLKQALDIPYSHHERWDGTGYPRGLQGEQIPLSARLFAVANAWHTLTTDYLDQPAWPESKAAEHLGEMAGRQFDPRAVELFFNLYLSEAGSQSRPSILIVDDEESVTRSLARSLKDQFTVLTAASGEEALRIVERSSPAVVLSDQRMPGMSGVELMEKIRAINPRISGILISGYSDVVALTAAINLSNVRGFIPKPWDLDSLREKLDQALQEYRDSLQDG